MSIAGRTRRLYVQQRLRPGNQDVPDLLGRRDRRPGGIARWRCYRPQGLRRALCPVDLAGQLGPWFLADLLGMHPGTAVPVIRAADGDWSGYAAALRGAERVHPWNRVSVLLRPKNRRPRGRLDDCVGRHIDSGLGQAATGPLDDEAKWPSRRQRLDPEPLVEAA